PRVPAAAARPPAAPGEFTRMFGSPGAPGGGPAPGGPPPVESQGATGVFEAPSIRPSQPPPAQPARPGEYTRLFGTAETYSKKAVVQPPAAAPAPASAPVVPPQVTAPVQPARKSASAVVPLAIAGFVLLFATLGLILYFVLKK
ncbi:MAG TPA: hypothetical protein VHA11_14785, partial [Bryobacteraceae bacterium]|nr:hypothetical protein [Bryobacteraceae bacterium]